MEKVLLTYRGPLREATGKNSDEACVTSVSDALKFIKAEYGKEAYAIAKRMLIAVNGKSILLLRNMKTPLSGGDTVSFLPISAGG